MIKLLCIFVLQKNNHIVMNTTDFALRHIGPRENDQKAMLETIGVDSIEKLIFETIPDDILLNKELP